MTSIERVEAAMALVKQAHDLVKNVPDAVADHVEYLLVADAVDSLLSVKDKLAYSVSIVQPFGVSNV